MGVPVALTQAGISAAVHVQARTRHQSVWKNQRNNYSKQTCSGAKQRRKVYSLTITGRTRAKLLVDKTLNGSKLPRQTNLIKDIPKGDRRILELLSHIDDNYNTMKIP